MVFLIYTVLGEGLKCCIMGRAVLPSVLEVVPLLLGPDSPCRVIRTLLLDGLLWSNPGDTGMLEDS